MVVGGGLFSEREEWESLSKWKRFASVSQNQE